MYNDGRRQRRMTVPPAGIQPYGEGAYREAQLHGPLAAPAPARHLRRPPRHQRRHRARRHLSQSKYPHQIVFASGFCMSSLSLSKI